MRKKVNDTVLRPKRRTKKSTEVVEYVIPLGNGWVVKSSHSSRFTVITDSKREAVMIARSIAKKNGTELIIHAKDGSIQERVKYAS